MGVGAKCSTCCGNTLIGILLAVLRRFATPLFVVALGVVLSITLASAASAATTCTFPRSGTHAGQRYVVYANEVRLGGTIPWRDNNPGDIRSGAFARRHGAIGAAFGFAVFPDMAIGTAAIGPLLQHNYRDMTVRAAIEKYDADANKEQYATNVIEAIGATEQTLVRDLNSTQFEKMVAAIIKQEHAQVGTIYDQTGPTWAVQLLDCATAGGGAESCVIPGPNAKANSEGGVVEGCTTSTGEVVLDVAKGYELLDERPLPPAVRQGACGSEPVVTVWWSDGTYWSEGAVGTEEDKEPADSETDAAFGDGTTETIASWPPVLKHRYSLSVSPDRFGVTVYIAPLSELEGKIVGCKPIDPAAGEGLYFENFGGFATLVEVR
jgi:hypothetical protein